jgi:hypothetical protein
MSEVNLQEAFGLYKTKASPRGRSALTPDGKLVLSCWYQRFQKAESGVLRYEEDISNDKGGAADTLRAHLSKALADDCDVQLIVATAPPTPKDTLAPANTAQRFIVEFRRRSDTESA